MKRTQKTRHALITSVVSMVVCFALLLGTTLAWFTDSVTNTGNTIQAGTLLVGLEYRDLANTGSDPYTEMPKDGSSAGALFTDTLWEPGKTNGVDLKVSNQGNLALDWALYFNNIQAVDPNNQNADITQVLDVYIIGAGEGQEALTESNKVGTLAQLAEGYVTGDRLLANTSNPPSKEFSVVLKMQENAGNEYQKCSVSFDLELRATQATAEADGFGNTQYDEFADGTPDNDWEFTVGGTATVEKPASGEDAILNVNGATVTVPEAAVDSTVNDVTVTVTPTGKPEAITVAADEGSVAYDIQVTGLVQNNATPIAVSLYVGKDLKDVRVYHNTEEIQPINYNASTGYVSFETTSFSPFTVVWDKSVVVTNQEELSAALAQGGFVKLGQSISIVPQGKDVSGSLLAQMNVTKDTVLNLQGNTVGVSMAEEDTADYTPLLIAVTSGELTINGDEGATLSTEAGEHECYGINVNGGSVVINGGSYYGALTAVQVQKGKLVINGGFFDLAPTCKSQVPGYANYVVNCIDSAYKNGTASIEIRGGTFVNFNPSANPEGAGTSYVADGYKVVSESKGSETWYTVVPE